MVLISRQTLEKIADLIVCSLPLILALLRLAMSQCNPTFIKLEQIAEKTTRLTIYLTNPI